MDPTDSSLRAYPGETSQSLQAPDHQYNNSMVAADSYNFVTGGGVLVAPLQDQASQLQFSEEGAAGQGHPASGAGLIGTLFTGAYPSQSPSVPPSLWEYSRGNGGLYDNPSMQNLQIGGSGMMTAPHSEAQLLLDCFQGGSFNVGGHSDHGGVYYPPAPNNQQEPMAQALHHVGTAGYSSNAGFHADGRVQASATTSMLYPTHDEGTATPQAACDQGQQQYGVDPYLAASVGGLPLSLLDQLSASRGADPNFDWRNVGNEHSFLPMNEDSQIHQSQFETDPRVPQFNVSRHDLSHMQQTDHMSNGVGLHMEGLEGIAVNGQGLSLSLSSHQSQFHSVGGQLQESDQMGALGQAAAISNTKELASRYLAGGNADLSRFRTHSRDDATMGARFLQEHIDSTAGRQHLAASSHGNLSGAGPSNHISASRFIRSAQAILNEVCRATALKRPPRPARSSDHQQYNNWHSMAGASASAGVGGTLTDNIGKEISAGSSSTIPNGVTSGRNSAAPAFNIHSSPLLAVSQMAVVDYSQIFAGRADAASTEIGNGLQSKKQKLGLLLEEVEASYRRYCDQLQLVVTAFNSRAGPNTATPYTTLELQAMSRHFRRLRDAIGNQLKVVKRALGEEVDRNAGLGESSRPRYVDQQRALQQLGMLPQNAWRPQRGLPERAVSVLRAWLFEHFLHPYPKDVDKLSLAKQTGLTRSQVSNWFINARVRLWKPMVEEMHVEEQKESDERQAAERAARNQAGVENGTFEQFEGDRGNSGLLHEVSANAQVSRPIPSAKTRNEDKEHVDNGPIVVTEVGGTSAEVHPHPVIPAGRSLDADVAGNHNQDGPETKKARPNSASEGFKPVIASPMPPGMNVEGAEPGEFTKGSESRVRKNYVEVGIDDVDESGEIGIFEDEGLPDLNGDAEVESREGEDESVPDSPKEKAMPAQSGASESSSSSGSSDSDSESSDSGDSRSGTSGSGSDSDSDGSSSDSDDDNMDEDVEIVSDDEDGDAGHQKPKAIDKKEASHQSKDAKRAKLKPPEKLQTQESEEIDIGGDEGSGQPVVDPEERANVVVENLDIIDDEVDVVSVGDGVSPQEMGSVSPERQTAETKIDVAGTPADVEDNRDLSLTSAARGNNLSLSKEEPDKTGEVGSQKDSSLGKPTDAERPKAGTLKGRINSMANNRMLAKNKSPSTSSRIAAKESPVHINNRLPATESLAQTSSPPRPESGAKSLLSSPALKKNGTEDSPRRANDSSAKRKINTEARKSFCMDGKTESEELVDKLVEAPMRPWPRPGKSAHPSQSFSADATPESGVRGSRDGEGSGLAGRETEAETLPSVSRPLRDGSWRHNPDGPGLLGKPGKNVEYLGRSQGRETEANVPSSRQVKNMRRGNNDPEGARRNEPMNDSDSWGKPARDLDGPRLGNDGEVMVNRLREGRKELTRSEGPKASSSGGFNRQNDKKGRESPDRESGEWRESTPGVEPMDMKGRDSLRNDQVRFRDVEAAAVSRPAPNKGQNRDLRKPSPAKAAGDFSKRPSPIKSGPDFRRPSPSTAAGDLRKPSPVKPVGDLRKPSPAKAAGDIRKPSPATSNAQKFSQIAQKELQKIDQGVARDSNRTGTGSGKPLSSSQGEDRLEGGPSRNGRATNDTFERPMESRGVKRQLDKGSSEPPRVYKKPSIAPVAPSSSLNRGVSDSGSLRPTDKKQVSPDLGFKPQNSESGRGGSSEIPASLAGPSAKAPSGVSRKQRPLDKGQKSSAKESMKPPKGRDWKAKNGAGLLGPGGDRRKDNPQVDPGLSNGKHLKSSSSPEEVSGKEYFAMYEKDSPDLRGPIRSHEEAEAYRKEYQTKYPVYSRLFNDLDKNGGHFSLFKRELVQATSHSDKQQISTKVRREFHAIRKEFKRMQTTFDILHEELQTIKQHLENFAGKAGQG
ncbi:hypothetical protein KC19_7G039300 [Ceratodon purpureus]|uniref:Homeobox domain-containing protein n=1 Tax=Ceratodon purpureus TaxID=3225 RepID=A0A8T0H1X6_CERPU|nr:hypothetical protein KC19_7G039300 [Ceratodon purpureus]